MTLKVLVGSGDRIALTLPFLLVGLPLALRGRRPDELQHGMPAADEMQDVADAERRLLG